MRSALSKKATAVIVTDDGKYVAGADKFGEVAYMEVADEPRGKIPAEFCLGHMSIVTCMVRHPPAARIHQSLDIRLVALSACDASVRVMLLL